MDIKIEHGDTMIVKAVGRLDTVSSVEYDKAIKGEQMPENTVVLDFTDIEYISSAGLRVLLALKKTLDSNGKALEIHNVNNVVREVFRVTGFINALTVK